MEYVIVGIVIVAAAAYLGWFAWRKVRAKSCNCGSSGATKQEKRTSLTIDGRST